MQAILQYNTPSLTEDVALMRGMCIENETLGGVKSCFGIQWRNDQGDVKQGYYWKDELNSKSWLINKRIGILSDPYFSDSPNLAQQE